LYGRDITALKSIDTTNIRDEYKVKIFSRYLVPSLSFFLSVHDLTATDLGKLDALAVKYLKSWLGLVRPATVGFLFHSKIFAFQSFSDVYSIAHITTHARLSKSADRAVRAALLNRVERESDWSRRTSTALLAQSFLDRANLSSPTASLSQSVSLLSSPPLALVAVASSADRRAKAKKAARDVKKMAVAAIDEKWEKKLSQLLVQGRFAEFVVEQAGDLSWQASLRGIPPNMLGWCYGAVSDSLATNANLCRWRVRSNSSCPLCNGQTETLHHVLNSCPTALHQKRFDWRHDSVLNHIARLVKKMGGESRGVFDGCGPAYAPRGAPVRLPCPGCCNTPKA
jgi:hypothetical protein